MKKRIGIVSTIVIGGLIGATANAETVVFDTTLASPDVNPTSAPSSSSNLSWYNGSGNAGVQSGWTVDTNNGIEIGLRAKYRQGNAIINVPASNIYDVTVGSQPGVPTRASWNYEFSIDLQPGGPTGGGLTLQDVSTSLTITDLTTGATATGDPMAYWADNTYFGTTNNGLGTGLTSTGDHQSNFATGNQKAGLLPGDYGFQNSENASFGDFPLTAEFVATSGLQGEVFDYNALDDYRFTLKVYNGQTQNGTTLLASNSIDVDVVTPEPSTWILLAIGGLALFIVQRRRSIA